MVLCDLKNYHVIMIINVLLKEYVGMLTQIVGWVVKIDDRNHNARINLLVQTLLCILVVPIDQIIIVRMNVSLVHYLHPNVHGEEELLLEYAEPTLHALQVNLLVHDWCRGGVSEVIIRVLWMMSCAMILTQVSVEMQLESVIQVLQKLLMHHIGVVLVMMILLPGMMYYVTLIQSMVIVGLCL